MTVPIHHDRLDPDSHSEILPGNRYRIWWIEPADDPAIVVSLGAPAASADAWFDGPASKVLETFRFFPNGEQE